MWTEGWGGCGGGGGGAWVIRALGVQLVQGLFQTGAYARAVTLLGNTGAAADEIDRRVGLRLKRQDLLTGPRPPQVWAVLDEGALRRPFGRQAVMRGRLNQLTEGSDARHVTTAVDALSRG